MCQDYLFTKEEYDMVIESARDYFSSTDWKNINPDDFFLKTQLYVGHALNYNDMGRVFDQFLNYKRWGRI